MANEVNLCLSPLILQKRRGAVFSSISLFDEDNEHRFSNNRDPQLIKLFSQAVKNNILFDHVDEQERIEIFETMSSKVYLSNDILIQQGEKGEHFYIIEQGEVLVYIDDALIRTMSETTCFGELALIHGTPRTATVKARTSIDSLETIEYQQGDVVFDKNALGDDLFIIVEGSAVASDHHCREMETLGPGDYFGRMTCLCNRELLAQITSKEAMKCLKINRQRFERVLGPIEDLTTTKLLKSNSMMSFEQI